MLGPLWKLLEWAGIVEPEIDEITEEERQLVRMVEARLREDPVVFKEYKGFVTQINNYAIELDHRWTYGLGTDDRFVIGDRVSYKLFNTRDDPIVKEVILLKERGQFVEKKLSGFIVEVKDRIYTVSNGVSYDKCKVKYAFEFLVLDHVILKGDYPKEHDDPCAFDLDLQFFIVKEVVPASTKLVAGVIKSFNPNTKEGIIVNGHDVQVRFHRNTCSNLVPEVGATVACNAIETQRDERGMTLRALDVFPNPTKKFNPKHFFQVVPVPKFQLVIGETKTIELSVSNHGRFDAKVRDVVVSSENNTAELLNFHSLKVIQPRTTRAASVKVIGDKLGQKTVRMKWVLANPRKDLDIKSSFDYEVVEQDCDGESSVVRSLQTTVFIPGVGRPRRPTFRRTPLKEYAIPQRIRELAGNDHLHNGQLFDMQIALQKEKPCLAEGMNETNYGDWMHTLLFLEEVADEKTYDKLATQDFLYKTKDFITFSFPTDSVYAQLVVGDIVLASKPWEKNTMYAGNIWEVSQSQVFCKFNATFENSMRHGAKYDLTFKMNRLSYKRRHQVVDLVLQNIGAEWLFPSMIPEEEEELTSRSQKDLNWINPRLNEQQKTAVRNILAKGNLPYPYIIYGPPGTGKTMTVLEAILQVYTTQPDCRILVAAPTNSAVDTVGVRLLSFGILRKEDMVRLSGYNAYKQGSIAVELMDISYVPDLSDPSNELLIERDDEAQVPTMFLSDLGKHKITIGTTSTLSILNSAGLVQGFFSHVIIDEAGQCTEPDSLLPIALIDPATTQLVLAGDPMQLGPRVSSDLAKQYSFYRSFLDRLTSTYLYKKKFDEFEKTKGYDPKLIARLVYNYRSLPKIVRLIGELFYDDDLEPVKSTSDSREGQILKNLVIHDLELGKQMNSVVFINVTSREEQEKDNFSYYNSGEVIQVLNVINFLYAKDISPDDIGVITPYSLQVRKIFALLDSLKIVSPKVASVEEFQGQERDIIILSLVRNNLGVSKKLSPFVTDAQRINVALSRARMLNVIVGNRQTLCVHPMWSKIIEKCHIINILDAKDLAENGVS